MSQSVSPDRRLLTEFGSAAAAAAAAHREITVIGPFTVTVSPDSAHPYRNYATIADDAHPTSAQVERLVAAFRAAERLPRLEVIDELAPRAEGVLSAAGFVRQNSVAVMVCEPAAFVAPGPMHDLTVDVRSAAPDWFLRACANTMDRAYGEPVPRTGSDITGLQQLLADGGLVALAREGCGAPSGAGRVEAVRDGIAEVTSIGVLPDMRRQGIGRHLTAALTAAAFEHGARVCLLTPIGTDEQRIYQRVGYREIGRQSHWWIPAGEPVR